MNLKKSPRAAEFMEILGIIHSGRSKAFEAVNVALIETYWAIGEQLSRKVSDAGWGKRCSCGTRKIGFFAAEVPDLKGFSASNLWRMKQFCLRHTHRFPKTRNTVARIVLVQASPLALSLQV